MYLKLARNNPPQDLCMCRALCLKQPFSALSGLCSNVISPETASAPTSPISPVGIQDQLAHVCVYSLILTFLARPVQRGHRTRLFWSLLCPQHWAHSGYSMAVHLLSVPPKKTTLQMGKLRIQSGHLRLPGPAVLGQCVHSGQAQW